MQALDLTHTHTFINDMVSVGTFQWALKVNPRWKSLRCAQLIVITPSQVEVFLPTGGCLQPLPTCSMLPAHHLKCRHPRPTHSRCKRTISPGLPVLPLQSPASVTAQVGLKVDLMRSSLSPPLPGILVGMPLHLTCHPGPQKGGLFTQGLQDTCCWFWQSATVEGTTLQAAA